MSSFASTHGITGSRSVNLGRSGNWHITELQSGNHVLSITVDGFQSTVHFNADEWPKLQTLVAGNTKPTE